MVELDDRFSEEAKMLARLAPKASMEVLPRQSYVVMGTGTMGGENYCGNLLWQSCLTLLGPICK